MGTQIDPVCGAPLSEETALVQAQFSERMGQRYYFCSMRCKEEFDRDPQRYLLPRDPVCGKQIEQRDPPAAELMSQYNGKHHYFCSRDCREKFEQAPAFYSAHALGGPPLPSEDQENLWR